MKERARPRRSVAQDSAFSRRRQRFESSRGRQLFSPTHGAPVGSCAWGRSTLTQSSRRKTPSFATAAVAKPGFLSVLCVKDLLSYTRVRILSGRHLFQVNVAQC